MIYHKDWLNCYQLKLTESQIRRGFQAILMGLASSLKLISRLSVPLLQNISFNEGDYIQLTAKN
jgi:hypothetical protein